MLKRLARRRGKKAARIKRRAKAKEDRAAEREEETEKAARRVTTKSRKPKWILLRMKHRRKRRRRSCFQRKRNSQLLFLEREKALKCLCLSIFITNKLPFCCIFVEPLTEVSFETNFLQNGFLVALRYRKTNQRHQPLSLTQRVRPEMHHFYMTWRRNWVSQAIANEGERKRNKFSKTSLKRKI